MGQLEVRDLELHTLAAAHSPILAPVELERLARRKYQRYERTTASNPGHFPLPATPVSRKSSYPIVGAPVTQCDQVTVHLPQITALLTAFTGLGLQPTSELVLKRIKLAGSFRRCVLRRNDFVLQIFTDGVPRQSAASADLAARESVP